MMETDRFDYPLPPDRIAQFPPARRTASRLLVVPPAAATNGDALRACAFAELGTVLRAGDVLVANNTRVLPARLSARKPTGGAVEIFLERVQDDGSALVQLRANKTVRVGQTLIAGDVRLRVTEIRAPFFVVECENFSATELFQTHGAMPLPPYITRAATEQDAERYQTVYAEVTGAVAAPTAGLHFDAPLINQLRAAGVHWTTVTLHVGAGTFQPVRAKSPAAHTMHREWMEVDAQTCATINRAKAGGGRVIAVGTTVVRALESAAQSSPSSALAPFTGDTNLFILPGHKFRAVDALITNFHLPRSTLLMMVCAFAGYDNIMRAYRHAIENDFRFYSYGDAMFAERERI